MKTFEELKTIIEDHGLHHLLCAYIHEIDDINEYNGDYEIIDTEDKKVTEVFDELGIGKIKSVESECNSDELFNVVYFEDHNIYIKFIGEYDSYGSGDHYYDSCGGSPKQVFPKEVTKTIYK